ncbi:MAG: hypothetical protein RMH74_08210 [Candidatus Caldarchaeum sp.]|nr:hypothetical protein [Candidatus Caldarchaeum sp.]
MRTFSPGDYFGAGKRKKKILDVIRLNNGWIILKTENSKSTNDFKVRTVFQTQPRVKSYTPKHAHFAIDFYGKLCADRDAAMKLLEAVIAVWRREQTPEKVIQDYADKLSGLPGYPLEYIINALYWILEQEDVNFMGRPASRQAELDEVINRLKISTPKGREGSQLAISLLCNIAFGAHPVDALIRANLDVLPIKKARGTA